MGRGDIAPLTERDEGEEKDDAGEERVLREGANAPEEEELDGEGDEHDAQGLRHKERREVVRDPACVLIINYNARRDEWAHAP